MRSVDDWPLAKILYSDLWGYAGVGSRRRKRRRDRPRSPPLEREMSQAWGCFVTKAKLKSPVADLRLGNSEGAIG